MKFNEEEIKKYKSMLFIIGGTFAGYLGVSFSKSGFGFEVPGYEWAGWGLGFLCIIVQVAFSSQLAYKSYNYVIFLLGILAYIYSGWSNYVGILSVNPNINHWFAFLLSEFLDWSAEPLIIFGLIGVSENGEGDFIRNLFGLKAKKTIQTNLSQNKPDQKNPYKTQSNQSQYNRQSPNNYTHNNNRPTNQNNLSESRPQRPTNSIYDSTERKF